MTRVPLVVECMAPARMRAPSRRALAGWAAAALGARGAGRELALKLVSQPQMQALNRRYRGKDQPTNVLAFPAMAAPGANPQPLGDVVICPAVLRREARVQGKTLQAHWAHLVVHGALHLAGFDHEVASEARRMERREIAVLRSLGFDNPYRTGPHD
jgi:probable rRNA maturation factor